MGSGILPKFFARGNMSVGQKTDGVFGDLADRIKVAFGKRKVGGETDPSSAYAGDSTVRAESVVPDRKILENSSTRVVVQVEDGRELIYQVGKHGDMPSPRPNGHESHHGVNDVWLKHNFPEHKASWLKNNAPAVLLPAKPDHAATKGVFNRWRAEIAERQNVSPRNIDWTNVNRGEVWRLSEIQFDVTNTPTVIRQEYFKQFNEFLDKL